MAKGCMSRNKTPIRAVNAFTEHNSIKDRKLQVIFSNCAKAYKLVVDFIYKEYLTNEELSNQSQPNKARLEQIITDDLLNIIPARMQTIVYQQAYGAVKSNVNLAKFYLDDLTFKFKRDYKREPTQTEIKAIKRHIRSHLACKISTKLKNIAADLHMVRIEQAEHSKYFDRWIRVMNLKGLEPIYIPYKSSKYKETNLRNSMNMVKRGDRFEFLLNQDVEKLKYTPKCDVIGIDFGLKDFMAINNKILGNKFVSWLKKQDDTLTKLQVSLQLNGLKPRQSKKYRKLVQRIRDYTKNEICRLFNLIVDMAPRTIRLENLEFRHQSLSKKLNRLLSKFANKTIKEKLQRLVDIYGINVEYVNPAYTSKECSECHYISTTNRVNTKIFVCKYCGNKLNANVNAARNIARRSCNSLKRSIKQVLIDRFNIFMLDNEIMRLSENKFLIRSKSRADVETVVRNKYLKLFMAKSTNA